MNDNYEQPITTESDELSPSALAETIKHQHAIILNLSNHIVLLTAENAKLKRLLGWE